MLLKCDKRVIKQAGRLGVSYAHYAVNKPLRRLCGLAPSLLRLAIRVDPLVGLRRQGPADMVRNSLIS